MLCAFSFCPALTCCLKHRPICKVTRAFKVLIQIKLPFNWIRITNWPNKACVIDWEYYYSTVLFSCTTGVTDQNRIEKLSPCPCSPSASPSRCSGRCRQPARWEILSGKMQSGWIFCNTKCLVLKSHRSMSIPLAQLTHFSTTPTSTRQSLIDLIIFICSKNDFPQGLKAKLLYNSASCHSGHMLPHHQMSTTLLIKIFFKGICHWMWAVVKIYRSL